MANLNCSRPGDEGNRAIASGAEHITSISLTSNPFQPKTLCNTQALALPHSTEICHLFDFQPATPLSNDKKLQLEKACPVKRANFYIGDLKIVALGNDIFNLTNHGEISARVITEVENGVLQGSLHSPLTGESLAEDLRQNSIAGYIEQGDLKIRIEEFPTNSPEPIQEIFRNWVERYRIAIKLADAYISKFGGSLTLLPLDDFGLAIAKALDELDRVSQLPLGGEKGIQKKSQLVHGSIFLNSDAGTQYKTILQFERDLFEVGLMGQDGPPEMYPRYSNRAACIDYLEKLSTIMSPSHRNRVGRRQAQFLLLHPTTEQVLTEHETKGKFELQLGVLATKLQQNYPSQDAWSSNKEGIERDLRAFIASLRSVSAPTSHGDYHDNQHFTEILNSILSSAKSTISGRLKLGDEFHTQLDAKKIGVRERLPNGQRLLRLDPHLTPHERGAINLILEKYPNVAATDWFSMCVPHTALTEEPLTAKAIRQFETYSDDSLVFLFGSIGQRETRIVVRTDPYRPSSWPLRKTARVEQLLTQFAPEELTEMVHRIKSWQSRLLNSFLNITSDRRSGTLPPFEVYKDYLFREYLDGKVAGLLARNELPEDVIHQILHQLGWVCATYFIAQRPALSFRELLIDGLETKQREISLLPIGLSETFCNLRAAHQRRDDFVQDSASLYGAHVASWISSFTHGLHCKGLGKSERKSIRNRLLNVWRNSFIESLTRAAGHRELLQAVGDECRSMVEEMRRPSREIPVEFDLRTTLPLSQWILKQSKYSLEDIADSFYRHGKHYSKLFDSAVAGEIGRVPSEHFEERNAASYQLLNNNLFTDEAWMLEPILDNRLIPIRSFPVEIQGWLITYADTLIKINRIIRGDKNLRQKARDLLLRPLDSGYTVENYRLDMKSFPASIRLSDSEADRFHASVRGLVAAYTTAQDENFGRKLKFSVARLSSKLLPADFLTRYKDEQPMDSDLRKD